MLRRCRKNMALAGGGLSVVEVEPHPFAYEGQTFYGTTTDAVRPVGGGISLSYENLSDFEFVSLVPDVTTAAGTDANGYRATEPPAWPDVTHDAPAVAGVSFTSTLGESSGPGITRGGFHEGSSGSSTPSVFGLGRHRI